MAVIELRGYVNRPSTISGPNKKFAKFTLAERQKLKNGEYTKVYYDVADFSTETPPEESAFVTVKGFLNIRKSTGKDGKEYTNLDITAKSVDVAPKLGSADTKENFDDLPF
jgi:hypothetical protein